MAKKIYEKIPRDEFGRPIYAAPRTEAFGELDGEYGDQPASSEVVDMDRETSIPYCLGRLESLLELHKSTPGAWKGHVKKGIAILQTLCSPAHESVQLGESTRHGEFVSPPPPLAVTSEFHSSTPSTSNDRDLANFAKLLR